MMYRAITHCSWTMESDFVYHRQIEIFIDQVPKEPKGDVIRIIILNEPHYIEPIMLWLDEFEDEYDYVFTYYEPLLQENNRAVKFLGVQTWIRDYEFPEKEFSASTLVSGKLKKGLDGHSLRHHLWGRRNEIVTPKKFFLSSFDRHKGCDYSQNLILGKKKDPLFDSMFHVAIENTRMKNMFTEKIVDCFQTKTIPIYWGAPDIGEYFNPKGVLIANSVDGIIDICNRLTPEVYHDLHQAIEDNYNRSMDYLDFNKNLDETIKKTLSNGV